MTRGRRRGLTPHSGSGRMMPTKEQDKQQKDLAKETHRQRSAFIVGQLMHALGRPAALYRVEVRPLWEDHYRVNVFVGADAGSTRVAQAISW